MCYFSAGSWENWRPDAQDYPTDILGNDYDGWPGEKWVDIRDDRLKPILTARLDLARNKGCDGVDPDNVNGYDNDTGFPITAPDQLAFNRWLAQQAHDRGLFIALKNNSNQAADLVNDFDAVVSEECYVHDKCDLFNPFLSANKPVWNIEYNTGALDYRDGDIWNAFCRDSNTAGRHDYWLPDDLDGSFRHSCQVADNLWNDLSIGFGDNLKFQRAGGGLVQLSPDTLILDENLAQNTNVLSIKQVNPDAFSRLHQAVANADLITVQLNKNWQTIELSTTPLQRLHDHGKAILIQYAYLGDTLSATLTSPTAQKAYLADVARLGERIRVLSQPVLVNFEPGFNQQVDLNDATMRERLIQLLTRAINQLKDTAPNAVVSVGFTDNGRRSARDNDATCGYASCAEGDKAAWGQVRAIYDALADQLDMVAFQEQVAQFGPDPQTPNNTIAYDELDTGIYQLPQRVVNLTRWLHSQWNKPVLLSTLSLSTATWSDTDANMQVDAGEITSDGWEELAQQTINALKTAQTQQALRRAGLTAISAIKLFDDPQAGGSRIFSLDAAPVIDHSAAYTGLVATGAQPGVDPAADGALRFKGSNGRTLVETLFARP